MLVDIPIRITEETCKQYRNTVDLLLCMCFFTHKRKMFHGISDNKTDEIGWFYGRKNGCILLAFCVACESTYQAP
jgi:hypothetical protein